ncbi:MAG: metallophosphoesterase [Ilumatobacteraceae bacterium]
MPRVVIAHITDTHIPGAGEATHIDAEPATNLVRVLQHASQRCAGILITGDCAAIAGTDSEYAAFAEIVRAATVPVWLAPGNHDDARKMQRLFDVPSRDSRCDYIVELPATRLIVLDSTREGREDGALSGSQLEWLDSQLNDTPAVVAMHHPCIPLGGKAFDTIRLDDESIAGLRHVVSAAVGRGVRIHALVSGHAHMTCFAEFAGVKTIIAPSSAYEFGLVNGVFSYQLGEPQYMEYSWKESGDDFLARVVTVDDSLWRTMR